MYRRPHCFSQETAGRKTRDDNWESAGVTRTYLLGGPLHELLDEHRGRSSIHGAAPRGGGPSERQAPATGSTRAEIGYPFPSREQEEAGSAAPSKLPTSCSGAGSKRNRPRQRKAGQGERWRGVEDGGGEEFAFGGQLRIRLVASWPFSFLLCAALCSLDWLLRWHGKFGLWRMKEREEERASAGGLKGRSLGQAD
jgi:hypothetical protein